MEFFGYKLTKNKDTKNNSIADKIKGENKTGALVLSGSNYYGISFDGTYSNQEELINIYRRMSVDGYVEAAIDEIIDETIVSSDTDDTVTLNLDKTKFSDNIKNTINNEFSEINNLLNFNIEGADIFKKWFVDGIIYVFKNIDKIKQDSKDGLITKSNGIKSIEILDPRYTKYIEQYDGVEDGIIEKYFIYSPKLITANEASQKTIKLSVDTVSYINSGKFDTDGSVLSNIHAAIKPYNQLVSLEDAVVVYRMVRAPERRMFFIDVGELPKAQAESYMKDIINKNNNNMVYDSKTGKMKENTNMRSMLEDIYLPRRDGSRSTEVQTLPSGCFSMDTKVSLLNGEELSISEIAEKLKNKESVWTYSCNPITGEVATGLVSWAGVTQKSAKVMKITLDNGESLICTPDHQFPIYGEGFKCAEDLDIGISMIPLYRKSVEISPYKKLDYEQFFDNKDKKWKYTHRMVADNFKTEDNYFIYDTEYTNNMFEVRHHKDYNRYNNNPTNLIWMSWDDHRKLHSDIGFTEENRAMGTIAAAAKIKNLKEDEPEEYQRLCNIRRKITTEYWMGLSTINVDNIKSKMSTSAINFINNLSTNDRKNRDEQSIINFKKGSDSLQHLLKDIEYKTEFYKKVSAGWTEESKAKVSASNTKRAIEIRKNPEMALERKLKHNKIQKIEYTNRILSFIIDTIKDKTTHKVTLNDVCNELNNNVECLEDLKNININKSVPNWNINLGFTPNIVAKIPKAFGYENWSHFRKVNSNHNHRIVNIEYLDEEIEVGTLTIDRDEKYNDYHTFALSCGIFTKNSNLGEMSDVEYFKTRLYASLKIPTTRTDSENIYNIGSNNEITRAEIKFHKYIVKLRNKFSKLFYDLLKTQLIIKKIITIDEWDTNKNLIKVIFNNDSHFTEMKEAELMTNRLNNLSTANDYLGIYFSKEQIQKNILRRTDEDIKETYKQIKDEGSKPPE